MAHEITMKQEGGLRVKPDYAEFQLDTKLPKITIITVVFNGAEVLERTIQSIVNQSYVNTEYLVIDGGSTDGTTEILWKYNDYIEYWLSESDNGLYYAMNKALRLGKGDYLLFINAGDELYSLETLTEIFSQTKTNLPDVYYGDTLIIDPQGEPIGLRRLSPPETLTWKSLQQGMLVSHQSIIVSAKLAYNYDLQYRFSADFDWMLRVLKNATNIHNTHLIISRFMDGGLTKKNIKPGLKERFRIMRKNYGLLLTLYNHFMLSFRFWTYFAKNKRF
ncbi:MAG: hypothetical protein RIS47_1508 [Bacteroidota bacterium]|jgi:glycosyltransferase involved in cell wall biosynthesis